MAKVNKKFLDYMEPETPSWAKPCVFVVAKDFDTTTKYLHSVAKSGISLYDYLIREYTKDMQNPDYFVQHDYVYHFGDFFVAIEPVEWDYRPIMQGLLDLGMPTHQFTRLWEPVYGSTKQSPMSMHSYKNVIDEVYQEYVSQAMFKPKKFSVSSITA